MADEPIIDWQPPEHWVRATSPAEFKTILAARRYASDPHDPGELRLKKAENEAWVKWHADPAAYRAARLAEIEVARAEARVPRSHAIARRLLELPDLPLIHYDDWTHVLVRSVRVDEDAEVFVNGVHVDGPAVVLDSDPEDDDD